MIGGRGTELFLEKMVGQVLFTLIYLAVALPCPYSLSCSLWLFSLAINFNRFVFVPFV